MHLALFGGTGRVGGRVIEYALADGHTVTALARTPPEHTVTGLRWLAGDVLDAARVDATLVGADAVITALGGEGLVTPGTARSTGHRLIAAAMDARGIRRIVAVAGGGILDSAAGGLRNEQPTFPAVFRQVTREHMGTWTALRASQTAWTILCPPDIVPGERTGRYRLVIGLMPDGARRISVENVADCLLRELVSDAHIGERLGIAD
jgi:uncharacterized protein